MGLLHIMERSGDDAKRFDEAMKRAKSGLMEACEIWEDMKAQFSERGGASYRYREDWDEFEERGGRGGMRRYR